MTAYSESAADNEEAVRYAGFWIRFVAAVIDGILLGIVGATIGFIVGLVVAAAGADQEVGSIFSALLGLVIGIAYYVIMESSERQATLGKMALGLRVTDMNGGRISAGTAAARYFSKILSGIILLIGYITAAFHPRKQALHDIIAKTLVVKR